MPAAPGGWRRGKALALDLFHEWRDDELPGRAAEIAFYALLSLFPGLLALSAALGSLDGLVGQDVADRVRDETLEYLARVLTSEADDALDAVATLFEESSPGVLTFGVLASLWSMSRAFAAVIGGLNAAYDIDERRSWIGRRLTALALAAGSVVVLAATGAILVLGPLFGGGQEIADAVGLGDAFVAAWSWLRLPVAVVLLGGWTSVVYHLGPFERTRWRSHLPGAALVVLWTLASAAAVRVYLDAPVGGNEVFGILGGALSLVLWLYVLALGLLLGGELNAVLDARGPAGAPRPALDPGKALARAAVRVRDTLRGADRRRRVGDDRPGRTGR